MPPASSREALAELGPWFELAEPDDGWRPLRELLDSPEALTERVAAVRAALGGDAVPLRVAASVAQLGLVARLLAPVLGLAVLGQPLPDLRRAWWRPQIGGPMPLAIAEPDLLQDGNLPSPANYTDDICRDIVQGPVRDIVELTAAMSVSRRVLWGNVSSGVHGAALMLGKARPDLETSAATMAAGLLSSGPLQGTSTAKVGRDFRRSNCCLLYRLGPVTGPKALCGDCVLSRA